MLIALANNVSSKAAKESFVSGHTGTSLREINAIIWIVPLAAFLLAAIPQLSKWHDRATQMSQCSVENPSRSFLRKAIAWSLETCVLVLPQIAVMMGVMPPELCAASIAALACSAAIVLIIRILSSKGEYQSQVAQKAAILIGSRQASFMSEYRGAMMMSTCIAILAVDFHAFPRRFAKVENFGSGLMDIGVGSFVAASGLVASGSTSRGRWSTTSAVHCLALLALGLARLVTTRSLDYQLAVGEYGQHWNFFLTLAAVKALTAAAAMPRDLWLPAGVMLATTHQAALSSGLLDISHSPHRGPSLISLNKEGLISLPGYWALHLITAGIGAHLNATRVTLSKAVNRAAKQGRHPLRPVASWVLRLLITTTVAWSALWISLAFISPISRRACNLPYILWTLAFNLQVLLLFAGAAVLVLSPTSQLFAGFNRHMLPVFLGANLLTGCVNMMVDTLSASDWTARLIVMVYTLVLSSASQLEWQTKTAITSEL
mmetsp:Transcript_20504/g.61726  ORF Transcript_20504/g.61726 Transcript_20504/m.61726 type:complete len:489 (+) Transcript_20504:152-1618(+)|eukprot:CAMPEP_0206137274 /NCGR_PEP_ID=MMETSP1473-20131121/2423_1 /ASSEMBLY_ACC=CAM_ASM_001109 /TAXON_ID=1461547 /ORGANISM="Stichococcus sp, Strain RCC1054" /LENGTH=488 /DNA_ID=CAMNT_0053530273 /DNA_START=87 /DNA_END=1553 /DNA_ORIENTATION=+